MTLFNSIFSYVGFISLFGLCLYGMNCIFCTIYTKEKGKGKSKVKKYKTYTKRWLTVILINGIIWVYLSYILAFIGREQIAETLSVTAVTSIITTMVGYFAKSAFEKKIGKEKEENEDIYTENFQ